MIVNVTDFMKMIGTKPLPPILLFGPGKAGFNKEPFEPYLAERALEKLVETYVDPSLHDLAYTSYYAEETVPGTVAEEARTLPFLAERRVIVVRNAEAYMAMASDKRSPVQPLLQYIESSADSSTLLILVAPTLNRLKQLYKACEKHGAVVECPQLDDKTYAAWIRTQIKRSGNTITPGAITALMDRVGAKMSDMYNAILLISNFAGESKEITEDDVYAASADVAEASIWALTDAIAASKPTAALEALHELLALSKSPDEIIGTLNWLLESTYRAHPDTPLKLGKPFVERKVAPLARKFSARRLAAALAMCTKTHFALRTTGTDMHLLLELLVIKLSAARK